MNLNEQIIQKKKEIAKARAVSSLGLEELIEELNQLIGEQENIQN